MTGIEKMNKLIEKMNKLNESVKTLRTHCANVGCSACTLYCEEEEDCLLMMEDMPAQWEDAEILTEREKQALSFIPEEFKWMARDKAGGLFVYTDKPQKSVYIWRSFNGEFKNLAFFEDLFQLVKWEDEEPVNLDDLRRMCDE